jgi:hypothetical protein
MGTQKVMLRILDERFGRGRRREKGSQISREQAEREGERYGSKGGGKRGSPYVRETVCPCLRL